MFCCQSLKLESTDKPVCEAQERKHTLRISQLDGNLHSEQKKNRKTEKQSSRADGKAGNTIEKRKEKGIK